jgi:hypothetical protein
VVVWDDDSATNTTMYIDGLDNAPSKTGTIGNIGDTSNTSNLSIGSQATTTHPFNGKLDDIRLFRFALSPMQVKKLFNDNANMRFGPKEGSP